MIRWVYAFVDRPLDRFEASAAFWAGVTGTGLSPRRGPDGEFVTLVPARGDAYLKLQGVHDGGGAHVDLSVTDVPAATQGARGLGAEAVALHEGWAVLRSPAGQRFCFVPWHGEAESAQTPAPDPAVPGPGGVRGRLDTVCIEVGAAVFEAEFAFWAALTGWSVGDLPGELRSALPVRLLLCGVNGDRLAAAHPHLSCSDPSAVRAAHEAAGARTGGSGCGAEKGAEELVDPAGGRYCLVAAG